MTNIAGNIPQFFDPIEGASRQYLDALQDNAIGEACLQAYENAPLIKQMWDAKGVHPREIKSIKDFVEKGAMLDKDDIRAFRDKHNDPSGGMSKNIPGQTVAIGTTSGTTGDPTPIPVWWHTPSEECYIRDQWQLGVRPGDYIAHIMFSYRGGHRRRYYSESGISEIMFSMTPPEMPRLVEASRRYRPTSLSIISNPFLFILEQYFEKTGEDPTEVFKSYKGGIFGGEPLGDRMKKVTKSWGLELLETTSLGDVAGASQCWQRDGFHAYEDMAFIETIDPITLEPIKDGEIGELVVTTLVDKLTPLIRYRTGDLVKIDRSPCGCGRNHARFHLLGRATDQILVEGRSILPRELMGIIELHSETRTALFQIIRTSREMDALRLRVGYDITRLNDSVEKLKDRILGSVKEAIGVKVEVEMVDEQELLKLGPPHKIPRVTKA